MANKKKSPLDKADMSTNPIWGLGLKNFRSIEEAQIEIKPLTIVVGGNSAGKSSVLSALRLLKQAQESNEVSHAFPLEGIEIELGQFSDLRRQSCSDDELVEISITHPVQSAPFRRVARNSEARNQSEEAQTRLVLTEMGSEPGLAQLQELEVSVVQDKKTVEYLSLSLSDDEIDFPRMSDQGPASFRFAQRRKFSVDYRSEDWFSENVAPRALVGRLVNLESQSELDVYCRLTTGGVPHYLEATSTPAQVLLSAIRRIKEQGVQSVIEEMDDKRRPRPRTARTKGQKQLLLDTIDPIFLYRTVSRGFFPEIAEAIVFSQQNSSAVAEQLESLNEEEFLGTLRQIDQDWATPAAFRVQSLQSSKIPVALFELGFALSTQLSHLGPLRQGPRRLYAYGERASANELGREAQYFAYSLRSSKDMMVDPFRDDKSRNHRESLISALSYWTQRLGVAESVDIQEEAGYGRKVRILMKGLNKPLDWEKVGVGVSQILPVIFKVLTSRENTITLIEQPELHLHPDAQAALADFLIAAARNGRNLIIETHSDALITRIRTRVAEESLDGNDSLSDLVTFIYASRNEKTGISLLRNVELTKSGSFDDWPIGFADQSAREAQQLLLQQARLAKKRALEQSPAPSD